VRRDPHCRPYFASNPDVLNELGSFIESGRSFFPIKKDISSVSGILGGKLFGLPHDIWVKRFNYDGFFSHLYQVVFGSKAGHLWRVNSRLYDKSLPVPEPVAFVGPTFRERNSFFLTIAVAGAENLGELYKKGNFREPEKIAKGLAGTLAEWHLSGAVHGDLKWSNILLQRNAGDDRFFFIDLDRSRLHRLPDMKGMRKDLVRFYRYGLELGAQDWVDKSFFPEYLACLTRELRKGIGLDAVRKQALRVWEKKGRRRH
jgi:tRNA A-37 threonylcarbamoyl transferase component Bud32